MENEVFYNISKIIERDSKTTTYKFALLRGVIEIIQENSPYIVNADNRIQIPTGLLIEKWLLYYYPILLSKTSIPQINGDSNLAFEVQFRSLIQEYETRGGFSAFYNDLKSKGIPRDLRNEFFELAKKLRDTITKMPMKYIGRSISNDYYSIFEYENKPIRKSDNLDLQTLIENFGNFTIPKDYFNAFRILGSFINGQDSLIFKWAEFSVSASSRKLSIDTVICEVLKGPITERNIQESKKMYKDILKQKGQVYCVWTGRKLSDYDIDHVIPFSVWKNNDLWNLLPSDKVINNRKRDRIPSPEILERQKDLILDYWDFIEGNHTQRFQKEIQVALLGNINQKSWKELGISQLQRSCSYLIETRGFEAWRV
jgi:hypothetical protein